MKKSNYLLLIDGDNINWTYLQPFKTYLHSRECGISGIYLFGKLNSTYLDDWQQVYPEKCNITTYITTEHTKNSTDMRMLSVALQEYYHKGIKDFIVLSSDADMFSLIEALPEGCNTAIGYIPYKTSQKYLAALAAKDIALLDLDAIRGPLTEEVRTTAINSIMRSYIRFKLGSNFFSYDTVLEWLTDRFPEFKTLTIQDLQSHLADITLKFTPDGVNILHKGGNM